LQNSSTACRQSESPALAPDVTAAGALRRSWGDGLGQRLVRFEVGEVRDGLGEIDQAVAGEDALPAHVLVPSQQEAEHADLQLRPGGEAGVSALGREHLALALPTGIAMA